MSKKLISILTPMLNEGENIPAYFSHLNALTKKLELNYNFEIVITDNCSNDNTWELLLEQQKKDNRIRLFRLSKNFGYQKSILTCYRLCRGDISIQLDADLQDPPELLEKFLTHWKEGYSIVYGIRRKRQEPSIITTLRKLFYRLLNRISENNLPNDAGDFILLDRRIIDLLTTTKDLYPYLRGQIFSFGFPRIGVLYERGKRSAGKSKFTLSRNFALAIDAILDQSVLPLRLALYLGIIISSSLILFSVGYLILYFIDSSSLPRGFTTQIIFSLLLFSINLLFLGIIGEYLGRIYRQVKLDDASKTIIQDTSIIEPKEEE